MRSRTSTLRAGWLITAIPLQSYGQFGTVWLPLQHIAMLPFVWIDALWRSGIAGSIPSMVAYVVGTLGIFRLVRARASALAAYFAAAIYALNPNLLYMQTTAMNEPIFLAFFIWTLVYLDEFLRATSASDGSARCNAGADEAAARAGSVRNHPGWRGLYALRRLVCRANRGCRDSVYLRALVAADVQMSAHRSVDGEIADRSAGAECAGSGVLVCLHLLRLRIRARFPEWPLLGQSHRAAYDGSGRAPLSRVNMICSPPRSTF